MSESTEQRLEMRRYLLGQLSDPESEGVEQRFLIDSTYRQELKILEDDLVDEYVAGQMPDEDKDRFKSHYLTTAQKREKLMVAEELSTYYSSQARKAQARPGSRAMDSRKYYALAAGILIVATAGLGAWVWFNRQVVPTPDLFQAQLNAFNESSSKVTPDVTILVPPNVTRQGGATVEVSPSAGTKVVELQLLLPATDYDRYQLMLSSEGSEKQYSLSNLTAQPTGNGRVLTVKLPAEHLNEDTFYIEVKGSNKTGTTESVADYTFKTRGATR